MLSILIPIYEVKVEKLVLKLIKQCQKENIEFEILCFDDGSSENIKKANRTIDSQMGVNYVELSENVGRSKIRNLLARTARYEFLLLLDADSKIEKTLFINTYLKHLRKGTVVCGGRIYRSKPPSDPSKLLHWIYGTKRESIIASERSKKKLLYFHSNNFAVDRHVMLENPFEEKVFEGYGYEDLALANQMNQRGVTIIHIDNPVIHGKLEKSDIFLAKGKNATLNLYRLYKEGMVPRTPLIKAFKIIDKYYLTVYFQKFYNGIKKSLMTNLHSEQPKMIYFDLYRLNYFITLMQNDEEQLLTI